MRPRLVSCDGEFALEAQGVTIGRDLSNGIRIDDQRVSGQHCRIASEGDRFVLLDSTSTNGTLLNGREVQRAELCHGDEIRLGMTILRFLVDETVSPCAIEMQEREQGAILSSETIQLDPDESPFLRESVTADQAQLRRLNHDMTVLLKLNAEIAEIAEGDALQRMLLERIFDVVPAEMGAILLTNTAGEEFTQPAITHHRVKGGVRMRVSQTIAKRVLESGQSILRNDLFGDAAASQSVVGARLQSVLCVPLSVMGARIGVVYLDTANSELPFDQRHLELVTAMAAMTAVGLEHLRYVEWLESENRQLTHEVTIRHEMIGQSAAMARVYESISRVAPGDSPVLILGESGTGKELTARAIHRNSSRPNGPFVVVNCAQITETLFASELFGHARGAFTGADRDRKGFVEEADGGTLFLDEIGDLPPHCQAALLRVVENGEVLRVGTSKPKLVDLRLLSATNRPLDDEIKAGRFRADLLYRLGLPLRLPPLRDRLEDIPLLVRFFLERHQKNTDRMLYPTPPETLRVLQEHSWPGNVRELGSAIRWAVVFGKSDRIRPEDLPPTVFKAPAKPSSDLGKLSEAKGSFERQLILRALHETHGVVSDAAILLGRAPTYLHRRISQLDLREELENIRKPK